MRLWEALDEGLLCPFQYFGVHDNVDLDGVPWVRGRYDLTKLSNVYTGNDARARLVFQEVVNKIAEPREMRALGFCVSVQHAQFMATRFRDYGLAAEAVTGDTPLREREQALKDLKAGKVNVLFTVDLFNEGVDIPEVDTVLFLRPTESATVFLQQLGRGLRLAEGKPCLTCLDFIGHQHANFRFDQKYRGLLRTSRRELEREIEGGFPHLPAGCHMELDRVASEIVLSNVKSRLHLRWPGLVQELKALGDVPLGQFLEETQVDPEELYRRTDGKSWTGLRRDAGFAEPAAPDAGDFDRKLGRGLGRLLHIDDSERLEFVRAVITGKSTARDARQERLQAMLHYCLWGPDEPLVGAGQLLAEVAHHADRLDELEQLLHLVGDRRHRIQQSLGEVLPRYSHIPLQIHATYRRDEIVAAFGGTNPGALRQGVRWEEPEAADFFLITLNKTEEALLPHHPVRRPRRLAHSLSLGVAAPNDGSFSDRPALHPPRGTRQLDPPLHPRAKERTPRRRALLLRRSRNLRVAREREAHAHLVAAQSAASGRGVSGNAVGGGIGGSSTRARPNSRFNPVVSTGMRWIAPRVARVGLLARPDQLPAKPGAPHMSESSENGRYIMRRSTIALLLSAALAWSCTEPAAEAPVGHLHRIRRRPARTVPRRLETSWYRTPLAPKAR